AMAISKRDVGELCLQGKLISAEQLQEVRELQQRSGGDIGDILVERKLITPIQLLQARAHLHNLKPIDVSTAPIDSGAVNIVPVHVAKRHTVMPIMKQGDALIVAVTDPNNVLAMDELKSSSGLRIQPVLGIKDAIEDAIAKHYGDSGVGNGQSSPAAAEED